MQVLRIHLLCAGILVIFLSMSRIPLANQSELVNIADNIQVDAIPSNDEDLNVILRQAKGLAPKAVQAHALQTVAVSQAREQQRLLALKEKMKVLTAEQAVHLKGLASETQFDVNSEKKREKALSQTIANLHREAQTLRVEADEREKLGSRLLDKAKELGLQAAGLQRRIYLSRFGDSSGPPAVSPQALRLLQQEASRMAGVLREDAGAFRKTG